jgi:hypothetical protein
VRSCSVLMVFVLSACGNAVPVTSASAPIGQGNGSLQTRVGGTELVAVATQGMRRICTYRSRLGGAGARTYHVGLGDSCPRHFPVTDSHLAPPPTAQLGRSGETQRGRECVYAQGSGNWAITLPITQQCPLNAGMAEAAVQQTEKR